MTFRNRIIEYGVKAADQFLANPKNARVHPQFQRDVMKAALTEVGFVAPVIESKSGVLLDGHERIWQGLQNNAQIPFVVVDVDENEEDYVLATFDPITNLATYDATLLDSLLQDVNSGEASIQQMLAQVGTNAGLYEPGQNPYDLWQGMPEFEQNAINAFHSIKIVFETEADMKSFAQFVGQTVTDKTTMLYYPKKESRDIGVYIEDES